MSQSKARVLARLRAMPDDGAVILEGTASGSRYRVRKLVGALPGQPAWELVVEPIPEAA